MVKKTAEAAPPEPDEGRQTYNAAHAILRDGKRYDAGDAIRLTMAEAKALLKSGAISDVKKKPAKATEE
ncbi:MAG: hypothetical protein COA65_08915 [Rhodospirillaceae bacterium]|nr:MAG: hypothetical protein COA65_08915 [Rhodospirillaceae bacterium]